MDDHGTLDKFVGGLHHGLLECPLPQENYVLLASRAVADALDGRIKATPLQEPLRLKS